MNEKILFLVNGEVIKGLKEALKKGYPEAFLFTDSKKRSYWVSTTIRRYESYKSALEILSKAEIDGRPAQLLDVDTLIDFVNRLSEINELLKRIRKEYHYGFTPFELGDRFWAKRCDGRAGWPFVQFGTGVGYARTDGDLNVCAVLPAVPRYEVRSH